MQSLNFKTPLKTYAINDDENTVIKINTTDYGLVERLESLTKRTNELVQKYKDMKPEDVTIGIFVDVDKEIRREIDYVLGEGVSQGAFGGVNCLSLCEDGSMIFENFLNCVVPVIVSDIENAHAQQSKHIEKYLKQAKGLAQ